MGTDVPGKNYLKGVAFMVNHKGFFQLLGALMCFAMNSDIKATVEELVKEGILTDEEYKFIVGKIEGRLK